VCANKYLVAAAITIVAAACHPAPVVQTAEVTRRPLRVGILADGTLEQPPGAEVRAPEGGVVGAILVREGQRVARGTPLIRLDNPDLEQRVLASRSESAQLAEEQQRSTADLEAAQRERDHLRAIVESDARLAKAGAITEQQRASDELNYQQAAQKAAQAEAHVADTTKRKQIVDDSRRALESRSTLLILRAPVDGIVFNLPRQAGVSIAPGQLVATVGDPQHVRVRARVDSPDLPRVRVGQRMIVKFDGLPNQQWEGTIILVPPGLREVAGREVGEVIGEINGDASGLPSNASVNVEIVVGEKAAALVIPRAALMRDGTRFVYRYLDGKARRTPVEVGLIGPTEVEITRGLRESDRVILPGGVPLTDGQSVKIAEAS
jgi:RND family efflux transporter MFP subunit